MHRASDNPPFPETFIRGFAAAVCTGPGRRLAECFTEDGVYHDGFYGPFRGRQAIAAMLDDHFHAHAENLDWSFKDLSAGAGIAYGTYRFHYDSRLPEAAGSRITMEGISRFRFHEGLIAEYAEVFDVGIGLVQLGFPAERIVGSLRKRAAAVTGGSVL